MKLDHIDTSKQSADFPAGFLIRHAEKSDVVLATRIIRSAFKVWAARGLSLSPMNQSEETTAKHLLPNGFIISTDKGVPVGTFSLEVANVKRTVYGIEFLEGNEVLRFDSFRSASFLEGPYLVFRKAAVLPAFGRLGLGNAWSRSLIELQR